MSEKPQEKTSLAADCHGFLKTITVFTYTLVLPEMPAVPVS